MNIKLSLFFFFNLIFVYSQNNLVVVKSLKINTKTDYFGASYFNNNQVVFTGNSLTSNGKIKTHKKAPVFDLYISDINTDGELNNVQPLEVYKSLSSFNIASSAFSPDGKYIYITTNFKPKGKQANGSPKPMKLRIDRGEYKPGKGWVNFKTLPFCNTSFSYGQPAISPDGKTLYFVSSMRGSQGSTDIYKVSILGDNSYGKPEQLGNTVNSRAKEVFPFISEDNYLYYSAKKKDGMGRLDIYRSKILNDGTYGESELLPAPINTVYDDYGLIVNSETKNGYFSSNRRGGKGGEDIYSFTFIDSF